LKACDSVTGKAMCRVLPLAGSPAVASLMVTSGGPSTSVTVLSNGSPVPVASGSPVRTLMPPVAVTVP
jgi:hypothetical protein